MKKLKLNSLSLLLLLLAGCYVSQPVATVPPPSYPPPSYSPPPPQEPAPPPADYQTFYDQLAPYGTWVSEPRYGYVWLPNAEPGFRPYVTDGYWAYSDMGWTWVSYYEWGWAPFHYGSWAFEGGYGWMWIPGHDWAPAWVTWGNYNGYYGWAPCGPGYQVGVAYNPPIEYWCFTEPRYMGNRSWSDHYYVSNDRRINMGNNGYIENVNSITIINNTNNYNSRVYNAGPRREEIERQTRVPIQTYSIRDNNSPGKSEISNNSLNIYRPRVNNESRNNGTAKPTTVVPIENVRQGERAPSQKQEQRSPEINQQKQGQQITPRQQVQPENRNTQKQGEMQQQENRTIQRQNEQPPAIVPQQRAPIQENQGTPRNRENQISTPGQQPQQKAPAQQNNGGVPRTRQQPQQQANPGGKRPVKPAKNKQDKKAVQKDNTVAPEKIEKK